MYTPLGLVGGPVRPGPPVWPPEAWLVLGFRLGVRVSPGYTFREGGVYVENRGVHVSSAYTIPGTEPYLIVGRSSDC